MTSLSAAESVPAVSSLLTTPVASVICYPAALYVFDMYNTERSFHHGDMVKRCLFAILLGSVVSVLFSAVAGGNRKGKGCSRRRQNHWSGLQRPAPLYSPMVAKTSAGDEKTKGRREPLSVTLIDTRVLFRLNIGSHTTTPPFSPPLKPHPSIFPCSKTVDTTGSGIS